MAVGFSNTNKPINPRGQDASPLAYNRAKLFSGKALDFDGVNDSVIVPQDSSLELTQGSWSCWFNIDAFGNYLRIIQKGHNAGSNCGYGIALSNAANVVDFWFRTTAGTEQVKQARNLEINTWYFATGTFDGTYVKVYINGIEVTEDSSVVNYSASDTTLTIGMRAGSVASPFNGEISGVRVFNTALTAAQVADLYNNPEKVVPTGLESNLKLWLPMMEGAGTTAYDGSGNGNHGTISGATYVNGVGAPVAQSAVISWNKGQNLYAYSEQFDESSYWSYTQIHAVDSTDNEAPDGSLTADKIIANTNTAFHHIGKGVTGITIGVSYRLSVWAKAGGHDYILINTAGGSSSGNAGPIVNLTNGSIAGSLNGEDYDATITDAGNGWYKIEYDFTSNGTTIFIDYNQLPSASVTAYAGDNTKGVYLWGASLRPTSSGSTYVRTGATAQTTPVLLPQGLTSGRDITGVNLFENVRKQGALNLDGNSWAEVHDNESLDITDAITLEAWYYHTGSGTKIIQGRWSTQVDNSYLMYVEGNKIKFVGNDGSSTFGGNDSTTDLSLDQFNHVVITYDRTNLKYYLNGVLIDTFAYTVSLNPNATVALDIGRNDGISGVYTGANYNNTPIAQPRIYNRALTDAEVLRNYNSGKNTYK